MSSKGDTNVVQTLPFFDSVINYDQLKTQFLHKSKGQENLEADGIIDSPL